MAQAGHIVASPHDPMQTILDCASADVRLILSGRNIRVHGASRLPFAVRDAITKHKPSLLKLLDVGHDESWLTRELEWLERSEASAAEYPDYPARIQRFERVLRCYEIVDTWAHEAVAA